MTTHVGFVSSEGGPYLIADAATARSWRGIDGPDYNELCSRLDERADGVLNEFRLSALRFVTWEPGVGVADVLLEKDQVVLVYPSNSRIELPAPMAAGCLEVEVEVASGVLAVLWAPESGECITDEDLTIHEARAPSGLLAINESSLLVPVASGVYRCFIIFSEIDGQNVKGLALLRKSALPPKATPPSPRPPAAESA